MDPRLPLVFTVQLSSEHPLAALARAPTSVLTPDGRTLVFGAASSSSPDGGARNLLVKRLDGTPAVPLAGVANAFSPFISPDGQWLGYFTIDSLFKVGLRGGAPVPLARNLSGGLRGGTWGTDGTVVYSPGFSDGLWRVPASGGTPAPLTRLDDARDERSHRWPSFLPCGCAVLFMTQRVGEDYDDADIEIVSLADGKRTLLVRGGAYPRYAPGGWLL